VDLSRAQFQLGVAELSQLPPDRGREVAFAGRSNAGKSSAINALTHRRKLAFVSKTPGRTQQINFFALGERCYLVDLPGYGYAKVARSAQEKWSRVLGEYLRARASLRALVLIMDIRHPLAPLDERMLECFGATRPVRVLLTKADKLSKQQAQRQLSQVQDELAHRYPACEAQLFSSATRLGVEEAGAFIAQTLAGADAGVAYNAAPAAAMEGATTDVTERRARRASEKKTPGQRG
jgi:GTP-binding protein